MSDDVKLRFSENGPIILTGEVEVIDAKGRTVTHLEGQSFCRCGLSQNKPFCDGHHETVGFKAPEGVPTVQS
jgi:CDGSH-type Zn-finger protein